MKNLNKPGKTILKDETFEKEKRSKNKLLMAEISGIEKEMTIIRLSQLSIDYRINKIKILLGLNE